MDNIDMKSRNNSVILEEEETDFIWFGLVFLFALTFLENLTIYY